MKKFLFIFLLVFILILAVLPVVAVTEPEEVHLENPLTTTDFSVLLGRIILGVMGVLGSITLAVFVVGGLMWLTAAGNAEKVKKGTQAMLWAIVGLFVIFSSYAILSMIFQGITGK